MKAYMIEVQGCGEVTELYKFDSMSEAKERLANMGFHRVAGRSRLYVGWAEDGKGGHVHKAYYLHTKNEWDVLVGTAYHI